MIALTQGDSYEQDYESMDVKTFDDTWTGMWAITAKIGTAPIAYGTLALSDDKKLIMLRILPEETKLLPVGKYVLAVQISNDTLSFKKEVTREAFEIQRQAIIP